MGAAAASESPLTAGAEGGATEAPVQLAFSVSSGADTDGPAIPLVLTG